MQQTGRARGARAARERGGEADAGAGHSAAEHLGRERTGHRAQREGTSTTRVHFFSHTTRASCLPYTSTSDHLSSSALCLELVERDCSRAARVHAGAQGAGDADRGAAPGAAALPGRPRHAHAGALLEALRRRGPPRGPPPDRMLPHMSFALLLTHTRIYTIFGLT